MFAVQVFISSTVGYISAEVINTASTVMVTFLWVTWLQQQPIPSSSILQLLDCSTRGQYHTIDTASSFALQLFCMQVHPLVVFSQVIKEHLSPSLWWLRRWHSTCMQVIFNRSEYLWPCWLWQDTENEMLNCTWPIEEKVLFFTEGHLRATITDLTFLSAQALVPPASRQREIVSSFHSTKLTSCFSS